MTSLGRGRGWASAQNKESVLRRPGGTISPKEPDHTNLINEINLLDDDETLKLRTHTVITLFNSSMGKENLKDIINKLYRHAVNNTDFRKKFLLLFTKKSEFKNVRDDNNTTVIHAFYNTMQQDFTDKFELRDSNVDQFRNIVCFLCETYRVCGTSILASAVIAYMEMLVETATLEDVEIVAQEMTRSGKAVYEQYKAETNKLMINIRTTLIEKDLCPTSRELLLYVIDLSNHEFNSLPSSLMDFYSTQLGNRSFILNTLKTAIEEIPKSGKNVQRNRGTPIKNVPRAIRGSGADTGRPGKHGKRLENHSKPKNEHDDRFEKDYD